MTKTFNSLKTWLVCGMLLGGGMVNAQALYPFPQDIDYSFGYKPSGASSTTANTAYTTWKAGYVTAAPTCAGAGLLRVKFDEKSARFPSIPNTAASIASVSEGIAYGMLLSSYYGDKPTFDGLWAYYKRFMNTNGIMNWGINNANCALVGVNGATDAELDAAWALWVAHNQFGGGTTSQYLTDAKNLIRAIKTYEVDQTGGFTLKPGDQFGGNNLVNPSYFSPAYYRVFGEITNDAAFWDKVYARGYDILDKAANSNTGLVPDWSTAAGAPSSEAVTNGYDFEGKMFFYDAIRTPVRTALDYIWYGDAAPRALSFSKKFNNWARGKHPNPADIGARYDLTGTKLDNSHNNTFVGAFGVSAIATDDPNTRSYTTALYNENVKVNPGAGEYFNASWKAISLFIQTGNFYLPPPDACEGPILDAAYNLCQGVGSPKALTLDAGVTANKYEWKKDGVIIGGATAKTYVVNSPGSYEITTTVALGAGKNCVRRAATTVYPALPTASFSFLRSGTAVDFTNTSKGGDLFSDPASLTSSWAYGTGATPLTSNTINGATQYATSGLKIVTLTVTNACGQSDTYTEQIPLPTAAGPGWMGTDFSSQAQGFFSAFEGPATAPIPNPDVTIDATNCQYAVATVKKGMDRYETVAITFKDNGVDAPLDVTAYPFVRFRIKIEASSAALFPNGLRVDLVDNTYKATGATPANLTYLQGPRQAGGGYDPIPVNEWFVSTISFEGKLVGVDKTKILQLAFTPYNDFPTATGREDFKIYVDWVTVGNKDISKPNPLLFTTPYLVCENGTTVIPGIDLDSCNSESVLWGDGYTKFSRTVSPGTYTVTVNNFAGSEQRTITVKSIKKAKAALTYNSEPGTGAFMKITPIDLSTGNPGSWFWHKVPTATTALSAANRFAQGQVPPSSPYDNRFLAGGGDFLCLAITMPTGVANCIDAGNNKACISTSPLSLDDFLNESTFAIYPTLVEDKLIIQLGSNLSGAYEVKISDTYGNTIHTSTAYSGTKEISFANNLVAGTYVVKVAQGNKSAIKKFIKQ